MRKPHTNGKSNAYPSFRYSIDDLLTPNSSLTNVTSLPAADTTRSLLAGHDGLTGNINNTTHTLSPSASVNNPLPTIDPLHGLLLGNTTAFDAVTTQGQDHHPHISPSQQQQTVPTTTETDSTTLHIKGTIPTAVSSRSAHRTNCLGISQSPFDLDDKEVAESMSCTTNYPLQFEGSRWKSVSVEPNGSSSFSLRLFQFRMKTRTRKKRRREIQYLCPLNRMMMMNR